MLIYTLADDLSRPALLPPQVRGENNYLFRTSSQQVIIMPGPGATDPMDLRAHARAHLGLSRHLKQMRCETPHPSCGGRGYDTWFCRE
jgi:hypothetical protein